MLVYRTVETSEALDEKIYEVHTSIKHREDGELVVSEQGNRIKCRVYSFESRIYHEHGACEMLLFKNSRL
jgi:hypothetical protein